jgi:hypothetical protein
MKLVLFEALLKTGGFVNKTAVNRITGEKKVVPDTVFNFFHCHKWVFSIRQTKRIPQYLGYWQGMVDKMRIISALLLGRLKVAPVLDAEAKKHNDLFRKGVENLTRNKSFGYTTKECLAAIMEENFQTIKTVLVIGYIENNLGVDYLRSVIGDVKEEFVKLLHSNTIVKNSGPAYMCADHYLEIKKEKNIFRAHFNNCPTFGVFKYLGFQGLSKEFCVLCEAHGVNAVRDRVLFAFKGGMTKKLSTNYEFCNFEIIPKNEFVKFLISCLPDFYLVNEKLN